MNTEKDNRVRYQNTFDEVHASEDLLRKVEAMRNEHGTFKKTLSKGAIAAAAFGILVFSNAITYAASGSPWILTISLPDGEIRQVEMEADTQDGETFSCEVSTDAVLPESAGGAEADVTLEVEDGQDAYRLEEDGGRICLILDEQHRIDITEDFRDGSCKGSFDADGMTWCYEVTGTPEDPKIQVYLVTCNTTVQ